MQAGPGVTIFRRSFWHWWAGFFVLCGVEFDLLNRFGDRRLGPRGMVIVLFGMLALPVLCAAGLQYLQAVEVSIDGIRLRVPVFRRTLIRFDDEILSVKHRRPLSMPQFDIYLATRRRPIVVPAYMGIAEFLKAIERAGGGSSSIARACRALPSDP